ncbi:peptidoglycan DD-metalloendopeptidase family protein [Oscillibacter valericigenes]|uniref:murein hydrolase activator EnvC family protein n=1 Tax=Oscillibacter ruminantium TaxID=1263547 RepID=UPI0025AA4612|nr:peptidoglycan DD-metalloendopeptidase family protein [Oscillibacter ruminantium]MDN0032472.1 peptidoglycan DD-metalloendopeptidase family protein [Oscillibacter valericigenes]MEA5041053.1 peptidoglycan DD-metalloendopeptidase family protein [Oscillibacter ruminantium]
MKPMKRIAAGILALMVICTAALLPQPVSAVTQADIDALKGDASDLTSQKKELEAKLSSLSDDKAQVLKKKEVLDQQIAVQVKEISNVESQISTYADLITQTQAELVDAQEREAAQYDLFCRRVRAMEEDGTVSYWSVLFKSDSFTDLLDRLDAVNEIMDADQAVIDQLKALQDEISEKEASLQTSKSEAEAAKADLVSKKSALEQQRKQANQMIAQLAANEEETEAAIDGMEEEEERIRNEIQELSRKLAAQQAANGQSSHSNPGGYIWPVDSRYITSTVGGRASPGGVGSTNHKGTDIGRVGYTSPIYASKAGTVIVSQYSRSYGNYVAISHGNGNTTLYGHMSSRKVEVGQYVNQGDVIGITGSTGNSTGPHLHFEVVENGVRVNPLSDGAAPKMGYLSGYTLSSSA